MTKRKAHLLRPLSKVTRPTRVIFLDTETQIIREDKGVQYHQLRLGYALHTKTVKDEYLRVQSDKVIWNNDDFWYWLDDMCYDKSKIYLVAHNWHFDSTVLNAFEYLPNMHFELTQWYAKATTFIMHWRRERTHLIFVDNGNIFQGKLADLGKIVGLPKLEVNLFGADNDTLLTYCKRDVEILHRLWIRWLEFLDTNDCGDFRYTVASQALETFRYRFMSQYIFIHDDNEATQLERNAYHGGRVEAKFTGYTDKSNYHYLDVNNMYGYVMSKFEYPCGYHKLVKNPSIELMQYHLESNSVIAEVELYTDDNPFPVVQDERLVYPVGHYTGYLCTPELNYALARDWVVSIRQMAIYPQRHLFKDYIETFYALRQGYKRRNNDIFEYICKLFNNSLYGKFGQLQTNQRKVGVCPPDAIGVLDLKYPHEPRHFDLVYLGGSIFEVEKAGEGYNAFCAIAAHVTAYARMHLWSLIKKVPLFHFYYSDTDSLIVDDSGYKSLAFDIDEYTLGKLKVELSSPWLEIHAPKDYAMEGRTRIKGVSSNAKEIAPNTFEQQRWPKLASRIRSGNMANYEIHTQIKKLQRKVTWGIPLSSGWVVPFVLE